MNCAPRVTVLQFHPADVLMVTYPVPVVMSGDVIPNFLHEIPRSDRVCFASRVR